MNTKLTHPHPRLHRRLLLRPQHLLPRLPQHPRPRLSPQAKSSRLRCPQGAAVKAGDVLVILEAMKMENEIVAPRDGTVAQVVTSKGAVVDTGAPLVVLA